MKNCNRTVMYTYINSGNHGCEAIARSTYDILDLEENENIIFSSDVEWDKRMKINSKWILKQVKQINGIHPISSLIPRVFRKLKIDTDALWKYQYKSLLKYFDSNTLAISTGGDVYCYAGSDWLTYLNKEAIKLGAKTVLWGCSIEERVLDERVIDDLKRYTLITVRESYTCKTLKEHGIYNNVKLFPDPAFALEIEHTNKFDWSKMGKVIGLNISKYIVKSDKIYKIFCDFIRYILNNTSYSIILIPHVFWKHENDLDILTEIYKDINDKERMYIVDEEYNCMQLKDIISHCTVYMGARTHSVIAAYSSMVPALAFSYSIKSRGIAYDLFDSEDNYVLPINEKLELATLVQKFEYIESNKDKIKLRLEEKIPLYKEELVREKMEIEKLF